MKNTADNIRDRVVPTAEPRSQRLVSDGRADSRPAGARNGDVGDSMDSETETDGMTTKDRCTSNQRLVPESFADLVWNVGPSETLTTSTETFARSPQTASILDDQDAL